MSRDSDKARELAERYEKSYWRRDDIEEVALAAMRYAYQEAAAELEHKASPTCAKCSLESRARDLGAE